MKIANTLFFVSTIVIGFSSCNSSRTEGDVSVLRDATYLVQYPICSGNQFGNCPKKGDIASSDCNKHLSSWNSTTEMCELTEDTECRDDFGAGIYQCGTPTLTESDRSDISAEDTTTENQMEEDTTTENQTEDDTSSNSTSDSPSSSEDEDNSTPSPSSSSNKITYSSTVLVSFFYVFSFGYISFGKNL